MIFTISVADSDSNEEALQEEHSGEDEKEGEVDVHVPHPRYDKILLFYLYQFF